MKRLGPLSSIIAAVASLLLGVVVLQEYAAAAEPRILVSNDVPGVVDAPLYDMDGVTRLSSRFDVQLFVDYGPFAEAGPTALLAIGVPVTCMDGERAGYFDAGVVEIPWAAPGDKVWAVVRVSASVPTNWGPDFQPPIRCGESPPFIVTLGESPAPLEGLVSFRLNGQDCSASEENEKITISWVNLYPFVTHYLLESGPSVTGNLWTKIFDGAASSDTYALMSVTVVKEEAVRFFRLKVTRP